MKLLLHVCCAPCSVSCIPFLREEGIELSLFWYNPNIHPYTEYTKRRDTVIQHTKNLDLNLIMEDQYGLRDFIRALEEEKSLQGSGHSCFDFPQRCKYCYRLRMEKTALATKENGCDAFCTTLLISPYQNHELLKEEAERAAEKYQTSFLYRDFRPLFREGQRKARTLGLYMQKYCGCIFSEKP